MHSRPFIVGVDGSPCSLRALREAARIAEQDRGRGGLDLVVVFVRHASWATISVAAAAGLAESLDALEAGVRRDVGEILWQRPLSWRLEVREGDPARELVKVAREHQAQTIVVGGHRHGALASAVVQSVNSELVHCFPGNLLIVRPPIDGCEEDPVPPPLAREQSVPLDSL